MRGWSPVVPAVLLAVLLVAPVACGTSGGAGPLTSEADEAYRVGDFELAYELYSERYEERPDPLLKEKMTLAWARAHGSRAVDADEAAQQIRDAKNMIDRGGRMLADGRFHEALKAFRTAQEYVPGVPEAREGEVLAEREISHAALVAATNYAAEGKAGRALAILDAARADIGEPFDPEEDSLARADAKIRGRIAATLLDRAKTELAADRPSTALLFSAAWLQVTGTPPEGPHPEPVNEILLRFDQATTRWIHVGEVTDGTDGLVDAGTFEKQFLAAWDAHGETEVRLTPDVDDADLALDLVVDALEVETSEPETKSREREFVVATEALRNPKLDRLRKERDRLDEDLRLAQDVARDARMEYHAVRRLEGDAEINARYSRLYGHYSRAGFYRHLANARTRNAKAKRKVDRLTDARDDVLARIDGTTPIVYRETRARATVEETTQSKSARAKGSFRLTKIREGDTFETTRGQAKASDSAKDTGWPGIEDQGIPEEPLLLPTDAELADGVLAGLAERLAAAVLAKARAVHRETYDRARELEEAGEQEASLDLYAAFLLRAREAYPLEARVAGQKIEAQWGLTATDDGGLDITNLRLDTE